jgi:hypothetical protein
MAPPVNRRCQIYVSDQPGGSNLNRCRNEGTHWVRWSGADEFFSWECDDKDHSVSGAAA